MSQLISVSATEQPNILFIFADDWGGDLSCHGHPYIRTPNIDRLAEAGTDFHRFTVASGVCSPTNAKRNMPDWLDPEAPLLSRFPQNDMIPDSPLPAVYGFDEYGAFNCAGEQMPYHEDAVHAIGFIERSHEDGKPFYINLWIHEPHTPFHTLPKYQWRFRDMDKQDKL